MFLFFYKSYKNMLIINNKVKNMIENVLTNYNINFVKSQLDCESISNAKSYYKIYNNKISEPLHKFWFSVPNLKYSNSYSDFKTIRFLMNDKNKNISNLINFIKDIGEHMIEKLKSTYHNISVDYPWKESEQFPHIFSLFTNNNTLFINSNGDELNYSTLTQNDITYSIIFEIASIRIIPIKLDDLESHVMKFNLALILIRQDEKKDLKKYFFTELTNTNKYNNHTNTNNFSSNTSKNLPFLNELSKGIPLNETKLNSSNYQSQTNNKLIINTEQILKAINGLKKVNIDKVIEDEELKLDDNTSQINVEYLERKNNLKKVKTKERSLLKTMQKKKKKKKSKTKIDIDENIDDEINNVFEN